MTFRNTKNRQRGLTLVEALVAIFILTIGIIPIFGVIASSVTLAQRIENNLIAANLAQEGVEIIRSIRDTSWMRSEPFDQNLPNGSYRVSWDSNILLPLDGGPYLKLDPGTKIYSYGTGSDTIFRRRIDISRVPVACNCQIQFASQVSWSEKGQTRRVTIEGFLFDWR